MVSLISYGFEKRDFQIASSSSFTGCGNSALSENMYQDGYHFITNIDYSSVVIENMKNRSPEAQLMKWIVMDITDMKFNEGSFDVVIEKATLDSLLVQEKSPWRTSPANTILMDSILSQVRFCYFCQIPILQ